MKTNSFTIQKTQMIKNIKAKHIQILKTTPQNLLLQININRFNELNDEDQWFIDAQQFQTSRLDIIFTVSQKINISTLVFKNQKNHLFLYQFLPPRFEQLTFLKLCDNYLASIEPISFIHAPNLEEINICGNRINCILPLVKLYPHQINKISIDKNNIIDPQNFFRYLARCQLGGNKKVCQMIKIQTKSLPQEGYPSLQCQDLSFTAKFYCQFLIDFKFIFSTRIQQETVRRCRRRKNLSNFPHQFVIYQ